MSSTLVIMDGVLDGDRPVTRTKMIGWTAFGNINPRNSIRIGCICTQAINGFCRERNQVTF